MKYLSVLLGVALCMASCTNDKKSCDNSASCTDAADNETVMLAGEWTLDEYNTPDGPVAVDSAYVITFNPADSTFSMTTDCNVINGRYAQDGENIQFTDLMTTRMMGPNMAVDTTFNSVLPTVETVVVTDSTITLQAAGAPVATFSKK